MMDIYQLKTFVAVAREGSVTRASEVLHLSQPAVSAHIKAIEDELGLTLFERTARGMSLTHDGERLVAKAEKTLAAHRELMDEAKRLKGRLVGKLRLGAGGSSNEAVRRLLTILSERSPDVEVALEHGTSLDILAGIRDGSLDAGFYNEAGEPAAELATIEVSQFRIHVAAAPGLVAAAPGLVAAAPGLVVASESPDWAALAELPWIYPTSSACCGRAAERLFKENRFRPRRVISVDREDVTRTLIAGGLGVGLLHADSAKEAVLRKEVELLFECQTAIRVLFARLASRAPDPLLATAMSAMRAGSNA